MNTIKREDLHIISQHSDLSAEAADAALKRNVYTTREDWQKFLQILFITFGVGFTVAGVIFFFAYNWSALHKFVKIGLIVGLIITAVGVALQPKLNSLVRNIVLTAASMFVGVLFAVFGQIYQTGANAYDFFLAWTIFTSIWVCISNFPPLTLIYLALINTTFILYYYQVTSWHKLHFFLLLFLLNLIAFLGCLFFKKINSPKWLTYIFATYVIVVATIGCCIGISQRYHYASVLIYLLTAIVYPLAVLYALKIKSTFYIGVIIFSLLIILTALLLKVEFTDVTLLLIALMNAAGIGGTVKLLNDLQKKWKHENN